MRKIRKQGENFDILREVMDDIVMGKPLAAKYKDHALTGNYKGWRECHLAPDWLLIYRVTDTEAIFERTGSHSELFKK